MKNQKLRKMTYLAMFIIIEIILSITPLGLIPLGFAKLTTLHIPVIVASILLGYKQGAIVGGIFGLSSMIHNTFVPVATSIVFSPIVGNGWSIIVAMVPRILLGIIPYFIYQQFHKTIKAGMIATVIASLLHTILVVSGIFAFFTYYNLQFNTTKSLFYFLMSIVSINGVLEAILAMIVVSVILKRIQSSNIMER